MSSPRPAPAIVLVGGCHRDLIARTDGPFEAGTSCPGRIVERPGGVARNVAVLVASAGLATALVGRIGADGGGRALADALAACGIETHLAEDPAGRTGTYMAVHDRSGEMVAAVSDLAIYDAMTPESLAPEAVLLGAARLVFADANLPEATIAALAAAHGARLAVDGISRAKAGRIRPALGAGALAFLNRTTAEALASRPFASPAEAAEGLSRDGVRRAVVTGGAAPVAVLSDGMVETIAVPAVPVVDETGAGDALTAGTLAALACGHDLADAVRIGIRAAGAALGCTGALDRLPADVVDAIRRAPVRADRTDRSDRP